MHVLLCQSPGDTAPQQVESNSSPDTRLLLMVMQQQQQVETGEVR